MVVVLCNCPAEHAPGIARSLVEESLAACVTLVGGARSIYTWEGRICDDEEVVMILKVADEARERLVDRLAGLHPYTVPEILVLPVDAATSFAPYVAWVEASGSR
jgi:periplasmic divalent cation tolerance protein